ncbi:MAG TPA: hypothetical protein VLG69_00875 [Candidatus Andersenbacteria bacterium]|nr:hypothetical protein [Candidatus Andersenbacteria bacterium]
MENQVNEATPLTSNTSKYMWPVVIIVIVVAIAAGLATYTYEHSIMIKSQIALEDQITNLQAQVASLQQSQPPNPSPTYAPPSVQALPSDLAAFYADFFQKAGEVDSQVIPGGSEYADITGDNTPETIFITIGTDCGSCEANFLHVFQAKKEIFTTTLDSPTQLSIIPGKGFTVTEPVRRDGEPLSNAQSWTDKIYTWNGTTFVASK